MTDALNAMFDDAAYDELIKEADVDNRVGEGNAIITKITDDLWPSGDKRRKVLFSLLFAGNAKADLTVSDLPSPEQVRAEKGTWDANKKRAIANSVALYRQFAQFYSVNPMSGLQEGQQYRVKTVKTKRNPDGSGGFVRIIAVLDPSAGSASTPAAGGPGF